MVLEVQGLKSLVHKNGYRVLENNGLVIIWMSVGNSYFKKEVIKEILEFTKDKFSKIRLIMPYEPAIYTYLGLGYEINKAKKKARLNSNRLKNISTKLIDQNNFSQNYNIKIIDWDIDIMENNDFKNSLNYINKLFYSSKEFNNDARDTTRIVLKEKMKYDKLIEEGVDIAVNYLLEELAFVLVSPKIFEVDETVYLYHRDWNIYENLVNGLYDNKKRKDVGFLLTKNN